MRSPPRGLTRMEDAIADREIDRHVDAWLRSRFEAPRRMPRPFAAFLRHAADAPATRPLVPMGEYLARWETGR